MRLLLIMRVLLMFDIQFSRRSVLQGIAANAVVCFKCFRVRTCRFVSAQKHILIAAANARNMRRSQRLPQAAPHQCRMTQRRTCHDHHKPAAHRCHSRPAADADCPCHPHRLPGPASGLTLSTLPHASGAASAALFWSAMRPVTGFDCFKHETHTPPGSQRQKQKAFTTPSIAAAFTLCPIRRGTRP
jgi:hypothetical protein